jgi:hypothetical protein
MKLQLRTERHGKEAGWDSLASSRKKKFSWKQELHNY